MAKIPPPALLQTVEAVVRLGSFKQAAEELGLTASAVSHRIRSIEAMAGRPLFVREGQGILPTEASHGIAQVIERANREMAGVWQDIVESGRARRFRLTCMAAFADHFIVPVIGDFKRRFPAFELAITSSADFSAGPAANSDIVIGFGVRPERGWHCETILDFVVCPIVRGELAGSILRDDMLYGPLLGYSAAQDDWARAAAALGRTLHPDAPMIRFDSVTSAAAAAENGAGIALVPRWIAKASEARGQVRVLEEGVTNSTSRYWLAVRRDDRHLPAIEKFRAWLRTRIADRS